MIVALVILAAQFTGIAWLWRWTAPPTVRPPLSPADLQAIRIARQLTEFAENYGKQMDVFGNAIADFVDSFEAAVAPMVDRVVGIFSEIGYAIAHPKPSNRQPKDGPQ